MNARLNPEVFIRPTPAAQLDLQLAADGVLRYVWECRYGSMLIEVKGGRAYVNGMAVEPADLKAPSTRAAE